MLLVQSHNYYTADTELILPPYIIAHLIQLLYQWIQWANEFHVNYCTINPNHSEVFVYTITVADSVLE